MDFQLKLKTCDAIMASNPPRTVKTLLSRLTEYGFTTAYEEQENGAAANILITKDEETYLKGSRKLSPDFIGDLARFTERCYVQFTLDELMSRMVMVGWEVELLSARFMTHSPSEERVMITTPGNDKEIRYEPTYSGMLALRHDLDLAEVTFIVGLNLPEMLSRGWKRTMNQDFYGFTMPDGKHVAIPFNDVAKAKEVVVKLKEEGTGAPNYANED